ncbi:hypothetical protein [Sphingomonas sp. A2-49]|uniref:hypothetical protein n=1 Tax=Sphingomonas sp. A2-49 TaxID=1391375 RepID=UPI0029312681|nr:hypothetical protein [Sphingomonas sp. A2-49]
MTPSSGWIGSQVRLHLQDHAAIMTIPVDITLNGRMNLAADIRKRLGLSGGGDLPDEIHDGVVMVVVTIF